MSSVDPHRPGLSEQLKFLDSAQGQLAPPPFDLDDIVRGGRRRHRRRAALNATGVAAAVIAVVAAVALGPLGPGADGRSGRHEVAGPSAAASPTPLPLTSAQAARLKYTSSGATVTVSLDGTEVATLTFESWSQTGKAVRVDFIATATRPLSIEASDFTLGVDSASSDNEQSPVNLETLPVAVGKKELVLHFETAELPVALLWARQQPDDEAGGGIVGQWELTEENKA